MWKSASKIYTYLLILYYILNVLFPNIGYGDDQVKERIYPQITMGIIGIWSLLICLFNLKKLFGSIILNPFILYLSLSFIYVFWVNGNSTLSNNFIYFLKFDMAILVMSSFYLFYIKNKNVTTKLISIILFIQILYAINQLLMDKFIYKADADQFDSNAGFILIALIPLVLMIKNKRLRLYSYILLIVLCIFSGQRSAALAAVLVFPWCIRYLKGCYKKKDILFISIIGILAIYPILSYSISNFNARMEVDANQGSLGSGRSIFWMIIILDFINSNIGEMIFGHGYFSVNELLLNKYGLEIEAHNGWLQNLYTFGIFGIIIYAKTVFSMITHNKMVNTNLHKYNNLLLICFLTFLVKSVTSHGNWDISVMPFCISIAIIAADLYLDKNSIHTLNQKPKIQSKLNH